MNSNDPCATAAGCWKAQLEVGVFVCVQVLKDAPAVKGFGSAGGVWHSIDEKGLNCFAFFDLNTQVPTDGQEPAVLCTASLSALMISQHLIWLFFAFSV